MKENKEEIRKKIDEIQKMIDAWKEELDDNEDYQSTGDPIFIPVITPMYVPIQTYQPDPCATCPNNPVNNPYASGVCNCVIPYMYGKYKITC